MARSDLTAPFIAARPRENRNVSTAWLWVQGPAPKLLYQMTNFTNGPRHWCEISSVESMSCFPKEFICCPAESRAWLQKYRAGFCSSAAAWVEQCWPRVALSAGVRWKIWVNLEGWYVAFSETDSFALSISPGNRDQTLSVPAAPQVTHLLHTSGARAEHQQSEQLGSMKYPGEIQRPMHGDASTRRPLLGKWGRSCGWAKEGSVGSLQSCAGRFNPFLGQSVQGWAASAGGRWVVVRWLQAELEVIARGLSPLQESSAGALHVSPCELPLTESKRTGWDFFFYYRQQTGTLLL